jgi:Fuc2NAc and GlcNAc transferase
VDSSLIAFALGGAASWWLLRAFIPYLRRRLLDHPNSRSSHEQPTPRGGGVAFVLVAIFACVLGSISSSFTTPLSAPMLALPLGLVGLLDDRYNLPATWRYAVQLATALSAILVSPLMPPSLTGLPLLVLLMIAVTAVINFTNFMDGLDGLVAGCMAVAIAAAAIQLSAPWPIWALVGALLGFLLWNWSPAKVFMGDVGSTFLGAVFAVLVLQAPSWLEALALLLVATPLLGDACLCLTRRLLAGQRVFNAHRLHLFQRLHQAGCPHACVSSLYIAASVVLAIVLMFGSLPWLLTLASVEILIGLWLDQHVAVPFAVASRS